VIRQYRVAVFLHHFEEQRLDELIEMIDLLQLAPAVLVELAVAREDMQLLQQFDGLFGADFGDVGHDQEKVFK
jgi:hypothetical protein